MDDVLGYRGKSVLVTGAASGMGRATADVLLSLGANVHGADIQPIEIEGLTAAHHVDLDDVSSIDALVDSVGGPIDALFNCAGIPGTFEAVKVIMVNYFGTRYLTERIVATMSEGAAVCCIGSTSALAWTTHLVPIAELLRIDDPAAARAWVSANAGEHGYPYDFSKEALVVYVGQRASSLAGSKIRLNIINPGATKTPLTPAFGQVMRAKEGGAEMLSKYPRLMGRLADPSEQAWPMVFLNSPRASFVTGARLDVDGGFTGGLLTDQFDPVIKRTMRLP